MRLNIRGEPLPSRCWLAILAFVYCAGRRPIQKSPPRDTGHATKVAAKDTAHATKVAAKDTAKGTEKAADKTAKGTNDVAHKTRRTALRRPEKRLATG